jgi:hypothetical protein
MQFLLVKVPAVLQAYQPPLKKATWQVQKL